MKVLRLTMILALFAIVFTQCKKDEMPGDEIAQVKSGNVPDGTYTVTVENVSTPYDYFAAGVQDTPDGKSSAGPAFPGESFTIKFHAGRKHWLSFASMYGASNDWFYAPDDGGIPLFSGSTALEGDITDMISLWDAGTEVDGSGSPGTPESEPIGMVSTDENNIQVLLDYDDVSMFTLTINVLSGSATPLAPVAWVVHSEDQMPIFTEGTLDRGEGLEALAEMGDPSVLAAHLKMNSGYVSPIAPVLWVLHDKKDMPVFTEGMTAGIGLETLAETGDPEPLSDWLNSVGYEAGFMAGPDGPLFPGQMLQFTIEGHVGQSLSIATMLGASNDEFFSFGDEGIKLSNGVAEKELTHFIEIYDAGTEVNEYPGAGIHQGGPVENSVDEMGNVRLLDDEFMWPDASQVIKVTIKKN